MTLYQDFQEIVSKYSLKEEYIKKILGIFEGTTGNHIVTEDIIPDGTRIEEFLTLSDEMNRAINTIHARVREISESKISKSASMFYFSQYGGSKTQFLNLVANEIGAKIPNCISVIFEGLNQVNPITIFEKLFPKIIQVIGKMHELSTDAEKFQHFSRDLQTLFSDVQVAIRQSGNLKRAEVLIAEFRKIKNPDLIKKVNDLDELLHSSILVDSNQILGHITSLMKLCSDYNIVFLFMFDEVDTWLDESATEVQFSKDFNRVTTLMKNVFDIPGHDVKFFSIFACHDRANRLFVEKQQQLEMISPAGSRLNLLYNSGEKVLEPGNYGNQIERAVIKISAFYHLDNGRTQVDFLILEKALPIFSAKYKGLSRRQVNSRIIQYMKNSQSLRAALGTGLKQWEAQALFYGRLIQDRLPAILARLNIKFVREDVAIDPARAVTRDRLDGYFENETLASEKIRTPVEIKLTKEFKGDKSYQALQWLQLHHAEHMVLIIFSPVTIDEVKGSLVEYAARNGYDNKNNQLLCRLHYIVVSSPIAFSPIIGADTMKGEPDKAEQFFDAFAWWLEFFGDFTQQYNRVKGEIGIDNPPIKPDDGGEGGNGDKGQLEEFVLNPDQQTILNLLTRLFADKLFSNSGRMSKVKIQEYVKAKSLGIPDVDEYFVKMHLAGIIEKIMDKTIQFSTNVVNAPGLSELKQIVIEFFREEKRQGSGGLDAYLPTPMG